MNITFWSPVHGQPGTTSNLSAIALYSTLIHKVNVMVMQTNYKMNNLEAPLIGSQSKVSDYFMDVGIDALSRSIKSAPLDRDMFYNSSVSLLDKQFSLLSGTTKLSSEIYEDDMDKVIHNIIQSAEKFYDIVWIDTNSGLNGFTPQILERSDLIVVNLNQNQSVLKDFFESSKNFDSKKIFYIIGNYDNRSKNNIKNLRKQYKELNSFNSSVVPYNTEFLDAQSDGQLIDFLKKNMGIGRNDKNRYFIERISKASNKILKKAGWKGGLI